MGISSWRFKSSPEHMEVDKKRIIVAAGGVVLGLTLIAGGIFFLVKYRVEKLETAYLENEAEELELESSRKEREKTQLENEISTLETKTDSGE